MAYNVPISSSLNRNEVIFITAFYWGNKNVYFLTNQKPRFTITFHAKVNVSDFNDVMYVLPIMQMYPRSEKTIFASS